nr:MAG TPA: hypothetical protein [Caudoviricetes sp.]
MIIFSTSFRHRITPQHSILKSLTIFEYNNKYAISSVILKP